MTSRLQALRDVTNTSLKRNGCGQKSTAPQKGKGANPSLSNARISARCDNTPDRTNATELSHSFASPAGGPIQSCPEAAQACDWRRQHFPIVTLSPNGRAELPGDNQHESPTSSAGLSVEMAKGTAELAAVYHYQDVTASVRTQNSSIAMAASPGAHDATVDDAPCAMEMKCTTADAEEVALALSPAHAQGGIEAPAHEPDAPQQARPSGSEDAGRSPLLVPTSSDGIDVPQKAAACATDGAGEHDKSETASGAAEKVETWWECDFCSRAFETLALASTHEERCARNPARAGILPILPPASLN